MGCDEFEFGVRSADSEFPYGNVGGSEFHLEVSATYGDALALVVLTANYMVDDDLDQVSESDIFGSVLAGRTRVSTVLGISLALGWAQSSGGTLSGTGLSRYYSSSEVDAIIKSMAAPIDEGAPGAIRHISSIILGSGANMRYS